MSSCGIITSALLRMNDVDPTVLCNDGYRPMYRCCWISYAYIISDLLLLIPSSLTLQRHVKYVYVSTRSSESRIHCCCQIISFIFILSLWFAAFSVTVVSKCGTVWNWCETAMLKDWWHLKKKEIGRLNIGRYIRPLQRRQRHIDWIETGLQIDCYWAAAASDLIRKKVEMSCTRWSILVIALYCQFVTKLDMYLQHFVSTIII